MLSGEQSDALAHVTGGRDLGLVVGPAGTGKSAMLGVAREAWEAAGYRVRGAALPGIAADGLESGSGIASRTIASLEHGWERGRDTLTTRDILVIDEAGMVGTLQLERVLSHAADAGAKVVLVGDPQQLQSIEAGAAFRALHERYGGARIDEVRRQHEDWQREATRDLASGHVGMAVQAYYGHNMVHAAETRQQAREDLIDRWDRERQAAPDESRIILTHTNAEVRALNALAREKMRAAGDLGEEADLSLERGDRGFASGDRIMFLQNDRVIEIAHKVLPEKLRDGVDGVLNRAFPLGDSASGREGEPGQVRHTADTTNRQLEGATPASEHIEDPEKAVRIARTKALVRHAQAFDAVISAEEAEFRTNLIYRRDLTAARKAFEEVRPYGWHDAEAAYAKDPTLARAAGSSQVNRTIRAL